MRTASFGLREAISEGKQPHIKVFVTWGNKTTEWLYDEDFMSESIVFQNATSSSGNFEVGGAIISAFNFSLNNWDGKFDDRDFAGAKITAFVGLAVATLDFSFITEDGQHELVTEDENDALVTENAREDYGDIEWLEYGTYYFVNHRSVGSVINCETLDALKLLDEHMLSDTGLSFPTTADMLVKAIADHNGINVENYRFNNYSTKLVDAPEDNITERQALAYVAQICGCYAVINSKGNLDLTWYGERDYRVRSRFDHNLDVEDVNITGVRVVYGTEDKDNALLGSEGYVIGVQNNPWITKDNYEAVAQNIGENVIGLTFRPGSMNALSDITIEVGDVIQTYDDKGTLCTFYVTSLEYRMSLRETLTCDAQPVERTDLRSLESSVFAERMKKTIRNELTAYDAQYMELSRLLSMSMGMYETREYAEDGSFVLYMHNKPKLADSSVVWKKTIDAFAVSTDYNTKRTWNYGVTADGNILANVLSVIGINAGWINAGLLTDAKNLNSWNLKTGELKLNASAAVGTTGYKLSQIKANADGIATKVEKNGVISSINQSSEKITINANKIDLSGYVTISNIGTSGKVTINGGNIKGGTITLGGKDNINGQLKLLNGSSKQFGLWNKDGLTVGAKKSSTHTGFNVSSDGVAAVGGLYFYYDDSGHTTKYGLWAKGNKGSHIGSGGPCDFGSDTDGSDSSPNRLHGTTETDRVVCSGAAWFDSKRVTIGATGGGNIYAGGDIYVENIVNAAQCYSRSDKRVKKNVHGIPTDSAYGFIMGLRPVSFEFKNRGGRHHGFLAQEVEAVADWEITAEENGIKSLAYTEIIADLVSVVQDLTKKVERLEGKA